MAAHTLIKERLDAALYETGVGILQIVGAVPSGNSRFLLTGTFSNPGPYGCRLVEPCRLAVSWSGCHCLGIQGTGLPEYDP